MFEKVVLHNYREDDLAPEYWARIDKIAKRKVFPAGDSALTSELADADCLLLKLGFGADRATIDAAPKLRYIGMLGTGVGRIDLRYAATKNIAVCNIQGYTTPGVAEFVFAALLAHLRDLHRAAAQAKAGNYSEATFTGSVIDGKAFGVIGLGRIGLRVAQMASQGFGARVLYWSRTRKSQWERPLLTYADVDQVLSKSDILSLHLEYNPETKNFLNADRLRRLRSGAVLINTAPMEIIDLDALEARLRRSELTFILDHSDELSAEDARRLSEYSNCRLYPPIAYTTVEATAGKQGMFVSNMESFLQGRPTNKVN